MSTLTIAEQSTAPTAPALNFLTIFNQGDNLKSIDSFGNIADYSGNVTTSDVLTNNFIARGNDTVDIDICSADDIAGIFTDNAAEILTIRPSTNNTAIYKLQDSAGAIGFQTAYSDSAGSTTMTAVGSLTINSTGTVQIAANVDLGLDASTGSITMSSAGVITALMGSSSAFVLDRPAGSAATSMFSLDQGGTNAALIQFFAGSLTPIGNVTGAPGDVYHLESGTSSSVFVHTGAVSDNTSWTDLLDGLGGNVSTSDTLTAQFLLVGNGTTDITSATTNNVAGVFTDVNGGSLNIRPLTGNTVSYTLTDSSGTQKLRMRYIDSSDTAQLRAANGLDIKTDSGNLVLEAFDGNVNAIVGGGDRFQVTRTSGMDTDDIMHLDTTGGGNGAILRVRITDRDPSAAFLSAFPNTIWSIEDGVNSDFILNVGASGVTTDYVRFRSNSTLHFGAIDINSSTTDNFLWPEIQNESAPTATLSMPVHRDGLLRKFTVKHGGAPGNGNSIVYTVQVNAIDTAITVTIASNSSVKVTDSTNTVFVSEGDLISVKATKAVGIGTSPFDIYASLGFE